MQKFQPSKAHQIAFSNVDYSQTEKLFSLLSEKGLNLNPLNSIKNPKRKLEWMTIRKLILELHPKSGDIIYDAQGKPHFSKSKEQLSISHSREMVAISVHQKETTGIDIQFITDKIKRIKSKFLSEAEQSKSGKSALELSYYWSCKEALFKVYGKKDGFLKQHFLIQSMHWDKDGGEAVGEIQIGSHQSQHDLKMRRIGEYVMAYVLNS